MSPNTITTTTVVIANQAHIMAIMAPVELMRAIIGTKGVIHSIIITDDINNYA